MDILGLSFRQNENPARACVGQGRGLGNPHCEHGLKR
jgi:hypothetical protein